MPLFNRPLLTLALVAAAAGAARRQAVLVEDLIGKEGFFDGWPAASIFTLVAVALLVASVLAALALRQDKAKGPGPRNFRKDDLLAVGQRLRELCAETRPDVPLLIDYTIFQAIAHGASDIHFDPFREGFSLRFRIDGMMTEAGSIPMRLTQAVTNRLKVLSNLVVYQGFLPQDGRLHEASTGGEAKPSEESRPADFRIAFMPTLHGERIVIRILGRTRGEVSFSQLGMNEVQEAAMRRFVAQPQGMMILTGPTGSGKTTTIYSALRTIQRERQSVRAIATLEDPIEYEIPGINQSQVDENKDFTFDKGLRAILRQDPDVIMVGEIRDVETARIAIQAGMTGHLLITTVHANSSASAFSRLLEMGVQPFALNSAVTVVISQRLLRCVCTRCATMARPTPAEWEALGEQGEPPEDVRLPHGTGCEACGGTGYAGRKAVFELLEVNEEIRRLVAEGAQAEPIYRAARDSGMKTLRDSCREMVLSGVTSAEEVIRVLSDEMH